MNDRKMGHDWYGDDEERAKRLRERGAEVLAAAARHSQRLTDIAESNGLLLDIPENLGSSVYQAALMQLELAATVVERTQRMADRVLDKLQRKAAPDEVALVEVEKDDPKCGDAEKRPRSYLRLRVCNHTTHRGKVDAKIDGAASEWTKIELTDHELGPGDETSIYLVFNTEKLQENRPHVGKLVVRLNNEDLTGRRFEIWVRPKRKETRDE